MGLSTNFDRVASYYDQLARLVYGKSIVSAQVCFLDSIPFRSKILVLGGGTGWILPQILNHTKEASIWYVEPSGEMLESAKRYCKGNNIAFIQGTEHHLPAGIKFDAVLLNFYVDLFTEDSLQKNLQIISASLNPDAVVLVADFFKGKKWWHFFLLSIMYRFFRVACHIEASKLPDWEKALKQQHVIFRKEKFFFGGFIKSIQGIMQHAAVVSGGNQLTV